MRWRARAVQRSTGKEKVLVIDDDSRADALRRAEHAGFQVTSIEPEVERAKPAQSARSPDDTRANSGVLDQHDPKFEDIAQPTDAQNEDYGFEFQPTPRREQLNTIGASNPATRTTPAVVFRWIAVLPAAVAASALLPLLVLAFFWARADDFCGLVWFHMLANALLKLFAAGVSGWAFVVAGAWVAPAYKIPVACLLLGITIPLVAIGAFLYLDWHKWFELLRLVACLAGSIGGIAQVVIDPNFASKSVD